MQAPIALPRYFAEILCPDFGFGSLREFRPRCRSFTVIHQVLPQNCASSVRKIYSQITLVQLCGIAIRKNKQRKNEKTEAFTLRSQFVDTIYFYEKQQPRGSAHSKAFAVQTQQPVGLYPQKHLMRATGDMRLGFVTLRGRKFPHGNFRTTRVLRSQNTTCRKNVSFSTG